MIGFLEAAWVIARRDFVASVFSRTFILFLVAPLILVGFAFFFGSLADAQDRAASQPTVAIVTDSATAEALGQARQHGALEVSRRGCREPEAIALAPTADILASTRDVRRPNARDHVSFGGGVHMCLGAHLARLEGAAAIGTLIRRFPGLDLATDEAEWNGRIVLRGLARLPVSLS